MYQTIRFIILRIVGYEYTELVHLQIVEQSLVAMF
jgi:hypothetical protein